MRVCNRVLTLIYLTKSLSDAENSITRVRKEIFYDVGECFAGSCSNLQSSATIPRSCRDAVIPLNSSAYPVSIVWWIKTSRSVVRSIHAGESHLLTTVSTFFAKTPEQFNSVQSLISGTLTQMTSSPSVNVQLSDRSTTWNRVATFTSRKKRGCHQR